MCKKLIPCDFFSNIHPWIMGGSWPRVTKYKNILYTWIKTKNKTALALTYHWFNTIQISDGQSKREINKTAEGWTYHELIIEELSPQILQNGKYKPLRPLNSSFWYSNHHQWIQTTCLAAFVRESRWSCNFWSSQSSLPTYVQPGKVPCTRTYSHLTHCF